MIVIIITDNKDDIYVTTKCQSSCFTNCPVSVRNTKLAD